MDIDSTQMMLGRLCINFLISEFNLYISKRNVYQKVGVSFFVTESNDCLWIFFIMLLVYGCGVVGTLFEHRKDKKCDLLFIKDKLVGIAEDERMVRHGRHYHTESAFYFAEHDRVVAGRSDIRLAHCGDEFLLVVRESRPDVVLAFYKLRFYRPEKFD